MASQKELYDSVTQRICTLIEQGTKPWQIPWSSTAADGVSLMPTNAAAGTMYRGTNTLLLWLTAHERGYPSHQWLTFRQANHLGGKIRKGEHGTQIIYTSRKIIEEEGKEPRTRQILKTYTVFSIHQCDGLPQRFYKTEEPWPFEERLNKLRTMVNATGIKVHYGASQACYRPGPDVVEVPWREAFYEDDGFASTLLHEIAHGSGHKSRLDRQFGKRFGDNAYAAEEIVAEMCSAFLCAEIGYKHEHDSAAYIDHWVKVMKADNRAIITAASYASHAADWIRSKSLPEQQAAE
jgi:antirestriction protein ArdC